MRPDGDEVLARWREVGEWWSGETPREIVRAVDTNGVRRETMSSLAGPLGTNAPRSGAVYIENNTEEVSLRIRKVRDEKVARACGTLPDDPTFAAIEAGVEASLRFGAEREATYSDARYSESLRAVRERRTDYSSYADVYGATAPRAASRSQPSSAHCSRCGTSTYVPLHVQSGYAFGRGTMLAEEIPVLAARFGLPAVVLADPFSLVGAVEFSLRAKAAGIQPLIGSEIELPCGGRLVLIAQSKRGYVSLSQLITECHLQEPRQYPLGRWERLERHSRDLICLTGGDGGPLNRLLLKGDWDSADTFLRRLVDLYGKSNVFVEIERSYLPWERSVNARLEELAARHGLRAVAGGPITHARPEHFPAQDILVCVDTLGTVEEVLGRKPLRDPSQPPLENRPRRALNAEKYLRMPHEMHALYADRPDLLENTHHVSQRCDTDVLPGRTQLPAFCPDPGHALREVAYAGALARYRKIDPARKRRIDLELDRIIRLDFAGHFLTIWDACEWAAREGILFSGRGSVVDSAVAHCLGISRIDAHTHRLHFDRFLPEDGSKRPDIDIDFEARRRDDVRNYLTKKYGEDRVATVAAVGAYCTRGIVREVGKALGMPPELIGYLAKRLHGGITANQLEDALSKRPELMNSEIPKERFRWVFELSERLMDVPRNIRAHSSGVVISSRPLSETVPVMQSASEVKGEEGKQLRIIQWDKRSAKYYFDKFDILCLRGQDVLSGVERRLNVGASSVSADEYGKAPVDVQSIALDDEETYRAMRSGELIGIPQSASPAMRQAHIRLRTANLHDASLVQAGIRPGVGGAVKINELIARRRGKPYSFDHPDFESILGITYGIIVFQEQVDQLLQTFGGYSSGEAEEIRESIHKRRREDYGATMRTQILSKIVSRGYSESVAEQVYDYVSGFKGYGFAQGHALAFAEISIRSIYCQQNFPAEYFASLLTAQPAGYYGPCTLANEARSRAVRMLLPDVNRSEQAFSAEDVRSDLDPKIVVPRGAIRTGLMQVKGLSAETAERIVKERGVPFGSFFDFVARVRPSRDELEALIRGGAFDTLSNNRRSLLWAIPSAQDYAESANGENRLGLVLPEPELPGGLADFSPMEKALMERDVLDMDVGVHLMAFERDRISAKGGLTSSEAKRLPAGRKAIVVGNPIRLRFPPTPSGKRVVFFDLEDETGLLNVTCFDAVYRRDGHAIVCSPYVTIIGEAQDRDGHTAFLAKRVFSYHPVLARQSGTQELPIVTSDFLVG